MATPTGRVRVALVHSSWRSTLEIQVGADCNWQAPALDEGPSLWRVVSDPAVPLRQRRAQLRGFVEQHLPMLIAEATHACWLPVSLP